MAEKSNAKFEVKVDKDNILHLKLGDLTRDKLADLRAWAGKVRRMVITVHNRTGQKVKTIIDIKDIKKYDSQAFLILAELMKDNEPYTLKTATFGCDEYILAAQDALLALSGRTNFRAFVTEKEAIDWLADPTD